MYQDHPHWQGRNRNNDKHYDERNYRANENRYNRDREHGPEREFGIRRESYINDRNAQRRGGYYENENPGRYYGNNQGYDHYDRHDYGRESRRMRNEMEQDWRGGNAYPFVRNEYHQQYYRNREHSPRTGYNYGGGNEYGFSRSRNYGHNNAGWVPERGFRHEGGRRERYRDEYNDDRYYNNERHEGTEQDYYRNNGRYRDDDRRRRY